MTHTILFYDAAQQIQRQRETTPDEAAEIDARCSAMPTLLEYESAVQAMLETVAQAHGYDSVISACSYAGAPNAFQAESIDFISWRGACWAQCHVVLNAVNAGTMAQPTIAELLATMPAFPT